uniref:Uncharacterized protein n=1 Tax=Arundo donax TaxID=35708 RepID=A0A0A9APW9_ARUDO
MPIASRRSFHTVLFNWVIVSAFTTELNRSSISSKLISPGSTSPTSGAADAFDCAAPSVFFAAVDFAGPDFLVAATTGFFPLSMLAADLFIEKLSVTPRADVAAPEFEVDAVPELKMASLAEPIISESFFFLTSSNFSRDRSKGFMPTILAMAVKTENEASRTSGVPSFKHSMQIGT